jgi:hypothetical protein
MRRRPRPRSLPRVRFSLRVRSLPRVRPARFGAFAVVVGLAAGCATSGASTSQASATCGRTRTGVNVVVVIKIGRGEVSCPAAMNVEKSYAALVRAGDVHGNGGGAPVKVNGWTCQGYTTAEILKTSRVSACTKGSAEIYALLPPPPNTADAPPVPS